MMFEKLRQRFLRPKMEDKFIQELSYHIAAQYQNAGAYDIQSLTNGVFNTARRDMAIRYTPVFRAVNMIGSIMAGLVTSGGLSVENMRGRKVNDSRVNNILRVLQYSPDNGITSSNTFFYDVACDYLLSGNALVVPSRSAGRMMSLKRFRPEDAYAERLSTGSLTYYMREAYEDTGVLEMVPAEDVIHVRWPLTHQSYTGTNNRNRFAIPTVQLMAEAVGIGRSQDAYLRWWYENAPKSSIHFNVELVDGRQQMPPDVIRKFADSLRKTIGKGDAVVTQGVTSERLENTPQDAHTHDLRMFQVEEIARFYGLPLPLMSVALGQWSRGVNEQVMKLAWRTCFKPHSDRLLSELSTKLLRDDERFVPDVAEIVRGDSSSIAEMINAVQGDAQRNPIASREEIRHLAGLPKEPEGKIIETVQKMDKPNGNQTDK